MTHSHSFFSDPRIVQAKSLILDVLKEHQEKLHFSPEHQTELLHEYHAKLNDFSELRGGSLWYPYLSSGFGKGALVELLDGSVKYDFISGIGAHFGHSLPLLVEANINAALQDTVMQGHLQQGDTSRKLLRLLIDHSGMDHGVLTTSGVMAAENALKICFQKKAPATRILAFQHCFMGRTLAVSQITDKPHYREGLPSSLSVDYIPFYDHAHPEESTQRSVDALRVILSRYPHQHAAMCFELIQGEGGYYPGTSYFFRAIMMVLKEYDIAIIVDEIQTFGRTECLFACHSFELMDLVDIVIIGKLSQVCATLYKSNFKPKPGLISQTFTASTSAIESSYAILNEIVSKDYLGVNGKIMTISSYFREKLHHFSMCHPHLMSGPFGYGGMIAFTPFSGDKDIAIKVSQQLFINGVISFISGQNPSRIRFLIPMGDISISDIDVVMLCIEKTLMELDYVG